MQKDIVVVGGGGGGGVRRINTVLESDILQYYYEEFKRRDRYNVEWLNFVNNIPAGQTSFLQVQR